MTKHIMHTKISLLIGLFFITTNIFAAVDPKFYIYLAFGQSNMEGQATIETQDKTVDSRFQVMSPITCSGTNASRTINTWSTATPPTCRCSTGLSPADYFGRTMIAFLPTDIKVGVVNVSVAGCKIELFDTTTYKTYISTQESWMQDIATLYGGNPYLRLVKTAKEAQKYGVIKGILLHQGESNTGDSNWPSKVKVIYDDLMKDLNLNPDSVPLLAGELLYSDQGGSCSSHNAVIAKLPTVIKNSYVVSSSGCSGNGSDTYHFNAAGYRELGKRYGLKMLSTMGIVPQGGNEYHWLEAERFVKAKVGSNFNIFSPTDTFAIKASNLQYIMPKAGIESLVAAPTDSASMVVIPFTVDKDTVYNVFARVNGQDVTTDSFWVKIDNGTAVTKNNWFTGGVWKWTSFMANTSLTKGAHKITIMIRHKESKLDKLCITNHSFAPTGMGGVDPLAIAPNGLNSIEANDGYSLANWTNPTNNKIDIGFEIPTNSIVSFQIFNMLGSKVAELAGKDYPTGKNNFELDTNNLPKGIYICTMRANNYTLSRKMSL